MITPFRRDAVDGDPQMTSKAVTDRVFDLLEALCAATSSPAGALKVVATDKKIIYQVDLSAITRLAPGGFKCEDATTFDDTGAPTHKVRVHLGMVAGMLGDPGFSPGDTTPLILTPGTDSGYVLLAVTVDTDGTPTSSAISSAATVTADAHPVYYLPLGTFGTDGDGNWSVTAGGTGNGVGDQSFALCGGVDPEWGPA